MRASGGASKAGLNREMSYSRVGEFRSQAEWQMKKKGGIPKRTEYKHTSQKCSVCETIDQKSRNGESFACVSCGWRHHADKNAAANILANGRLHLETGGQAHLGGGAIAGIEVVIRRKDHGPDRSTGNDPASRLGSDKDDIGMSDRTPESALVSIT